MCDECVMNLCSRSFLEQYGNDDDDSNDDDDANDCADDGPDGRCGGVRRHVSSPQFCEVSICAAAGSAALGAVSFHVILVFASAVSRASPIWAVLVVVLACCSGAFSAGLHAIPCHVTGIGFALPHALPVLAVLAFIFALGDRTFRSAWINDHSTSISAFVHLFDNAGIRGAQLSGVSYYVDHIPVSWIDRNSAVARKSRLSVMHDGVVIVFESASVDLSAVVLVKVVPHAGMYIIQMDGYVVVTVWATLFVMKSNGVSQFVKDDAFNSAAPCEGNWLRSTSDRSDV